MTLSISDTDSARPAQKSATAFRTISEVADDLGVPQHVLRFWETKFPQVRPMKRGGGRRYYRPEDIETLKRIHALLHAEGYTIKGAQRLLKQGKAALAEKMAPAPAELPPAPAPLEQKAPARHSAKPAPSIGDLFGPAISSSLRQKLEGLLDDLKSLRKAVA